MNFRKIAVLFSISIFGAVGNALLARGMRDIGSIDVHHAANALFALANPWVILGILCLLGFMWTYMTALSFADLTYVLPATAIGYVFMALISIFWLHEHVSIQRWAGIVLIVCGVGLVAGGPSKTEHAHTQSSSRSQADALSVPPSAHDWRDSAEERRQ